MITCARAGVGAMSSFRVRWFGNGPANGIVVDSYLYKSSFSLLRNRDRCEDSEGFWSIVASLAICSSCFVVTKTQCTRCRLLSSPESVPLRDVSYRRYKVPAA